MSEDECLGHAQQCLAMSRQSDENRDMWIRLAAEGTELANERKPINRRLPPDWSYAFH